MPSSRRRFAGRRIPQGVAGRSFTITLAIGVRRHAERHVIIRACPWNPRRGHSFICSDKPGTLTARKDRHILVTRTAPMPWKAWPRAARAHRARTTRPPSRANPATYDCYVRLLCNDGGMRSEADAWQR
ncbi:hypothetical protein BJI67_13665 [Acidihalobacter aeolianus]|uniref:Uncharacterized protein n=1 Tax=Acidihalobacter aeolianus TaxID=2792603 RepID=A0A1D8KAK8_9GAMM|nr:hypothetical protein [Acidihalobacter aeolianus]AOV17967.1 hypothetical protein BJI67_13665 [Acidihalobacter aeolianus]